MTGAGNRVTRFKNYAVSYDSNGAVTQIAGLGTSGIWTSTDTTQFYWNAAGQLTRVVHWPAGGAASVDTFFYDARGRRVGKSINGVRTWFVYEGDHVVMDVSNTGALLAQYGFAGERLLGMKTAGFTGIALTTPQNGTVLGLASAATGAEIKRYDVLGTPWGQQSADTGTVVRYRMGSQEYDQEIGLYHLGARYYHPGMGRFISEDPIGVAGGLNVYAYAGNDPVGGLDPVGLDSPTCGMGVAPECPTLLDCITITPSGFAPGCWDFTWADNLDWNTYLVANASYPTASPDGAGPGGGGGTSGESPSGGNTVEPARSVSPHASRTDACGLATISALYTLGSNFLTVTVLFAAPEAFVFTTVGRKAGELAFGVFMSATVNAAMGRRPQSFGDFLLDNIPGRNLINAGMDAVKACGHG